MLAISSSGLVKAAANDIDELEGGAPDEMKMRTGWPWSAGFRGSRRGCRLPADTALSVATSHSV
jgi:hypothetical protein